MQLTGMSSWFSCKRILHMKGVFALLPWLQCLLSVFKSSSRGKSWWLSPPSFARQRCAQIQKSRCNNLGQHWAGADVQISALSMQLLVLCPLKPSKEPNCNQGQYLSMFCQDSPGGSNVRLSRQKAQCWLSCACCLSYLTYHTLHVINANLLLLRHPGWASTHQPALDEQYATHRRSHCFIKNVRSLPKSTCSQVKHAIIVDHDPLPHNQPSQWLEMTQDLVQVSRHHMYLGLWNRCTVQWCFRMSISWLCCHGSSTWSVNGSNCFWYSYSTASCYIMHDGWSELRHHPLHA